MDKGLLCDYEVHKFGLSWPLPRAFATPSVFTYSPMQCTCDAGSKHLPQLLPWPQLSAHNCVPSPQHLEEKRPDPHPQVLFDRQRTEIETFDLQVMDWEVWCSELKHTRDLLQQQEHRALLCLLRPRHRATTPLETYVKTNMLNFSFQCMKGAKN